MKDLNDLRLKQKEERLELKEEIAQFNEEKIKVQHDKALTNKMQEEIKDKERGLRN